MENQGQGPARSPKMDLPEGRSIWSKCASTRRPLLFAGNLLADAGLGYSG
jgi:hypothetical protein